MAQDNPMFLEERRQALEWSKTLSEFDWIELAKKDNTSVLMLKMSSSAIHRHWHQHTRTQRVINK